MNNKNLLVVPIFLCAACAPIKDLPENPHCPGGPKSSATVTLVPSGSARVSAAPPVVCVEPGSIVTFRVTPANKNATIATTPKRLDDGWMFGVKGSGVETFTIKAEGDPREDPYFYNVFWQGRDALDPRVTIRTDR